MRSATTASARGAGRDRRRTLALAGLALWAIAAPWTARALGQALDVPARLEVVDHVVPGLIALGCAAALVGPLAAGARASLPRLGAMALAGLAGFWITATHAALVPEAIDGVSPWGAAVLHLSAGPPITVLALWLLLVEPGA